MLALNQIVGDWRVPVSQQFHDEHHVFQNDRLAARNELFRTGDGADSDIARRRILVKSNPNATITEVCEIFDRQRVPLPTTWLGVGFASWSEALKNLRYRARIKLLISRDAIRG